MCGSLKLEGSKGFIRIRQYIPSEFLLNNHHQLKGYTWNGFARADGSRDKTRTISEQWSPKIWVPEILRVEEFTERNRQLEKQLSLQGKDLKEYDSQINVVFPAKRIAVLTSSTGDMKIITRPSKRADEIRVHDRMPLRIPEIMTRSQFIHDFNKFTVSNYH